MSWRKLFALRLRSFLNRNEIEAELDEELRFHLAKQVEENIASGMIAEEARYAALRSFGGLGPQKEECRDARRVSVVEHLFYDVRHALRALKRDPLLTITATLILAVSIGANTTVFGLVNATLLRPLSFPSSDHIYFVSERMGREQMEVGLGADYYSLREQNRVFSEVGAYDTTTLNWSGLEKPEQVDAAQVTPSFFKVLGSQPMLGRFLAKQEEGIHAPAVVVLSYAFWRSRMAGDPDIVGKEIVLDRVPNTIVGVMPQGFDYPRGAQIWRPLPMDESSQRPRSVRTPLRLISMVARLKPHSTAAGLDAELARLTLTIRREYPKEFDTDRFLDGMKISATPLQRRITGDLRPALLVLSVAVGLVLLIACANLANLLLAKSGARQREIAIRMAIGSDRGRIIRQVLTESLILAVPGGLAGAAIAYLAIAALNTWKPLILALYPAIVLDYPILQFTVALTTITALVFGIVPALATARTNLQDALKSGGYTHSSDRQTARVRQFLIVTELGISLLLLVAAGLLSKSFLKLAQIPLGFQPQNQLTFRVNLVGAQYATADGQQRFYAEVLDRLRRLPAVSDAGVSTGIPLSGDHPYQGMIFQVAGRSPLPEAQRPLTDIAVVSPQFFSTAGIPLRLGRTFHFLEDRKAPDRIVINEAFARKIFPGENPLGRQITAGPGDASRWTIVGVVASVRGELGVEPEPLVYRCVCQTRDPFLTRLSFFVRTTGDPRTHIRDLERQVYAVDPNQPVFDVKTMEQRLADSFAPQRFHLILIGTFAAIALLLAGIGVYGVMSYLVMRRSREIGVRLAMGARPAQVVQMVVGQSLGLALFSVLLGLLLASVLTRYLASMLFGVEPIDLTTFLVAPLVLFLLATAASLLPARRASRIDPVLALRHD